MDEAVHPPYDYPDYRSTRKRAPTRELYSVMSDATIRYPLVTRHHIEARDSDLTRQHAGVPIGERITVSGRVLDAAGNPLHGTLVEIWQANAAGRYAHDLDQHPAPLDPNFTGAGRCVTDADGQYRFETIRPGAYPWGNHENAWRPAHIHFSVVGASFAQRLVTQMYFPGDPLLEFDPIFTAVPRHARDRLIARWSIDLTEPERSLGYEWNIVLAGGQATPGEEHRDA